MRDINFKTIISSPTILLGILFSVALSLSTPSLVCAQFHHLETSLNQSGESVFLADTDTKHAHCSTHSIEKQPQSIPSTDNFLPFYCINRALTASAFLFRSRSKSDINDRSKTMVESHKKSNTNTPALTSATVILI